MSLDLKSLVRTIPDYPKKGILFRDITTLIEHPEGFKESVERLAATYRGQGITHVAGIEARGFIFGAGVAIALGVGFIPIRKKGKLPGETIGQNYALEYGVDTIEIHADVVSAGHKVLLVDDLIATGGTAIAAVGLLRRTGASCDDAAFVIDLPDIGGAAKLAAEGVRVQSLIAFEGH
ncbi:MULTISPECIES: adenine phosphoribosyltransferase [Devosia]|uniref:Adenine phosphoribosyltransferase n=1 Tax=Devosia equisanguinis TaxID=2490941 RepID=A0A447IDQ5_9HYPH|nr:MULTISPECIES: adenine phosphoribosyltransferase [Devosia]ODT49645.1 MAG: adenine phosphoribosyltransferase [Pelagibacterium sp. SCN 63-126]ODU87658.1 MAG: adenine phosphoribosyltransferase [Pelagibacterium sp. SCN 63-17]OJX45660.1 MAG: adenine phosphoribosyltransferase [Devosia sp. 63-57]VDS05607.1 Adenine phosphoribosyltransferase [Devosia equisanguinis]